MGGPRSHQPFSKKSENERDRITRMPEKEQEKYAEEALHELNEKGQAGEFSGYLAGEMGAAPKARRRR